MRVYIGRFCRHHRVPLRFLFLSVSGHGKFLRAAALSSGLHRFGYRAGHLACDGTEHGCRQSHMDSYDRAGNCRSSHRGLRHGEAPDSAGNSICYGMELPPDLGNRRHQ